MGSNDRTQTATDPLTQFWADLLSRMGMAQPGTGGASAPAQPAAPTAVPPDVIRQMQRAFFDALAKYFDEYMRSEQFLQLLKESMDRSLQFKQQVDQFLAQLHRGVQSPAKADVDDLAGLLKSIEERLLARLERLEEQVAAVEDARRAGGRRGASPAKRPPARAAAGRRRSRGR